MTFLVDRYLALEDVLAGMVSPSVCDLKMGTVASPPDLPDDKRAHEAAKYAHRDTVGFIFTGMKVFERCRDKS